MASAHADISDKSEKRTTQKEATEHLDQVRDNEWWIKVVSDEKRPGQHFWYNKSKKYATWTQPAGWTARWKEIELAADNVEFSRVTFSIAPTTFWASYNLSKYPRKTFYYNHTREYGTWIAPHDWDVYLWMNKFSRWLPNTPSKNISQRTHMAGHTPPRRYSMPSPQPKPQRSNSPEITTEELERRGMLVPIQIPNGAIDQPNTSQKKTSKRKMSSLIENKEETQQFFGPCCKRKVRKTNERGSFRCKKNLF